MTNYSPQQIDKQYEKLPAELKSAMVDADIAEKMIELGKKHGLTIEKTGFLAEETGFVVLGLTKPEAFVRAISDRLGIDTEKAKAIARDINHEIFLPLREALKSTHDFEVSAETIEKQREPLAVRMPAPSLDKLGAAPPRKPEAIKKEAAPPPRAAEQEPKKPGMIEKIFGKTAIDQEKPRPTEPSELPPQPQRPAPRPTIGPQPPKPPPSYKASEGHAPQKVEPKQEIPQAPKPSQPETAAATKIPPIDLRELARRQKPMGEPEPAQTPKPPTPLSEEKEESPPPEKKMPYGGTDPYREPPE